MTERKMRNTARSCSASVAWRCPTAHSSNSLAASSSRVTIADGTGSRSIGAFLEPSVLAHRRLFLEMLQPYALWYLLFGVGTTLAGRPLHTSRRAALPPR